MQYLTPEEIDQWPPDGPSGGARSAQHRARAVLAAMGMADQNQQMGQRWKVWFFWVKRFQIGGRSMSLYTLENDIIRPFGDERIHFALNCMTVSCPRLPRVPFATAMLNEQLDASTRAFFADPRNLQVDRVSRVIRASEILKFYQDDFLKRSPNLVGYVNRYLSDPIPEDFALEFIQYDWTVNGQNVKH